MDIDITAKITVIRKDLGIPEEGFEDEARALDWYKVHYQEAKGAPFQGGFGYRFGENLNTIEFDFCYDPNYKRISINFIPPIDKQVPLDTHADSLAWDGGIDAVHAPALRLTILVGTPRGGLPLISSYIAVGMGSARLLMHPPAVLSDEMRRRILDEPGTFSTGITQGYLGDRQRRNMPQYLDVSLAYGDWIEMKRTKKREGTIVSKKGYLKWIAKRLVDEYGWDSLPNSYTVCRYLERARNIWSMPDMDD